ncbi:hypothetical protein D910_01513, partial [Dendroctonus ponderosae]
LVYNRHVATFTSSQDNEGQFNTQKNFVTLVDLPVFHSIRQQFFEKYKASSKGIVYVVDSVTLAQNVRDAANVLYNILIDPAVVKNRPQLLILCNKQDQTFAKGCTVIKSMLEKELATPSLDSPPPPPLPPATEGAIQVKRSRMPKNTKVAIPIAPPTTASTSATPPPTRHTPSMTGLHRNRDLDTAGTPQATCLPARQRKATRRRIALNRTPSPQTEPTTSEKETPGPPQKPQTPVPTPDEPPGPLPIHQTNLAPTTQNDSPPEAQPTTKQRLWIEKFKHVKDTTEFEDNFEELMKEVKPSERPQHSQHPRRQGTAQQNNPNQPKGNNYNAQDASRIQKLYRKNRQRAFREVIDDDSPFCRIPSNDLHAHFTRVFSLGTQSTPTMPTQAQLPPVLNISDRDPLEAEFTPAEVWKRIIRCSNTAPGPDGVRYSNWRKFDVGAQIIAAVLNCAKRLKYTPKAWTTSLTILIHKKGSREDVTNWRPISLSNTIAKIHTSVLAERLGAWATRNSRLGESQKGFLQMDGCAEHNFVLQSIIADARRNRRQCCVAWLDLANAFGSIPHETIFQSLGWSGLSDNSIDVIRLLYENNTTSIRSSTGPTPAIHIKSGVKQGCPLSPIIFNLAIEPILHAITACGGGYRLMGKKINSLAYADDMAIIAENPSDLQRLLDTTTEMANWAGLSFNTKKCATLHIDGRRKQAITTAFNIQGGEPAILGEHELYEHLGVPTGYHTANSADEVLQAMSRNLEK